MLIPHHCGEYILYALAQIKNIPYVVMNPQVSCKGDLYSIGANLENIGEIVKEEYESYSSESEMNLGPFMSDVLENTNANHVMDPDSKELVIKTQKEMMSKFYNPKYICKDIIDLIGIKLNIIKREHKEMSIETYKSRIRHRFMTLKLERKMDHIADYEKLCKPIDVRDKYVYYPLQSIS